MDQHDSHTPASLNYEASDSSVAEVTYPSPSNPVSVPDVTESISTNNQAFVSSDTENGQEPEPSAKGAAFTPKRSYWRPVVTTFFKYAVPSLLAIVALYGILSFVPAVALIPFGFQLAAYATLAAFAFAISFGQAAKKYSAISKVNELILDHVGSDRGSCSRPPVQVCSKQAYAMSDRSSLILKPDHHSDGDSFSSEHESGLSHSNK